MEITENHIQILNSLTKSEKTEIAKAFIKRFDYSQIRTFYNKLIQDNPITESIWIMEKIIEINKAKKDFLKTHQQTSLQY